MTHSKDTKVPTTRTDADVGHTVVMLAVLTFLWCCVGWLDDCVGVGGYNNYVALCGVVVLC